MVIVFWFVLTFWFGSDFCLVQRSKSLAMVFDVGNLIWLEMMRFLVLDKRSMVVYGDTYFLGFLVEEMEEL